MAPGKPSIPDFRQRRLLLSSQEPIGFPSEVLQQPQLRFPHTAVRHLGSSREALPEFFERIGSGTKAKFIRQRFRRRVLKNVLNSSDLGSIIHKRVVIAYPTQCGIILHEYILVAQIDPRNFTQRLPVNRAEALLMKLLHNVCCGHIHRR